MYNIFNILFKIIHKKELSMSTEAILQNIYFLNMSNNFYIFYREYLKVCA